MMSSVGLMMKLMNVIVKGGCVSSSSSCMGVMKGMGRVHHGRRGAIYTPRKQEQCKASLYVDH